MYVKQWPNTCKDRPTGIYVACVWGPGAVDSKELEYAPGTIDVGVPSSLGFGVGGRSDFNFLTSTAILPGAFN